MRGPFPGMDPYLEDPVLWPDVHSSLITQIRDMLASRITPHFFVRIEQRVFVVDPDDPARQVIVPDLYVARSRPTAGSILAPAAISPATLVEPFAELEVRDRYLDIYDAQSRAIVATIEVLSPANKLGGSAGRAAYLRKRQAVTASPAHWIEIDLLRAGERPAEVADRSDYYALLKRGDHPGPYEVWYVDLRDHLPTIAVPLRPPFDDVPLDLQVALDSVYERAFYAHQLDYADHPPAPPLRSADAVWASERVREWQAAYASGEP
jgi:hypothetical protein